MEKEKIKQIQAWPVMKTIWGYATAYPKTLGTIVVSTTIVHVLEIVTPLFYKRFFDVVGGDGGVSASEATPVLVGIIVVVLSISLVSWLSRRIREYFNIRFEAKVMADIANDGFEYMFGHSHRFFVNNFAGSLVRKVNRLVRSFEQIWDNVVLNLLPIGIVTVGILAVLFYRNIILGLTLLVWLVLFVGLHLVIAKWKQKYNLRRAAKDSEATGVLSDAISNQTNVKLFSGNTHEEGLFARVQEELRRLRVFTWTVDEVINMVQGLFMIGLEFALMYFAIGLWKEGVLTVGDFALIQAYLITIFGHFWHIGGVIRRIYEAFADATEMVEILDMDHEIRD
ncbi:MAG: ABC transporter ATP-binding protein, partial [Parcubacteria group bacterium]|nr:ABC transporter ATP-binding protein [Parcubacteria group bacterium]